MADNPTTPQDVPSDAEFGEAVSRCIENGLFDPGGLFRYLQQVRDRTQAAMLARITQLENDLAVKYRYAHTNAELEAELGTKETADPASLWEDGKLKWGSPLDVGHLIAQLRTLNPKMKVSSVMHIDHGKSRARAYGLSMSRERWDEDGWLNYKLDVPECLAIWATPPDTLEKDRRISELEDELKSVREDKDEYGKSFDLRWNADMRAIAQWRVDHLGTELVMPDHADLCVWLLEQLDSVRAKTLREWYQNMYLSDDVPERWLVKLRRAAEEAEKEHSIISGEDLLIDNE